MSNPVTYTAVLPVSRKGVDFVADLLAAHRRGVGTRAGRRALTCEEQAVGFWRWMLDAVRIERLAADLGVSLRTGYRYVHEALDVVAGQAPSLHGALLAARAAGHTHVNLDGTLIRTDRVSVPGPTSRKTSAAASAATSAATSAAAATKKVDLWWSGKHHAHGGNIQVVTAPDGWPLWVSGVRPGREHDVTCARTDPDLLPMLEAWTDEQHAVLADLGYEGERRRLTCPLKAPQGTQLREEHKQANRVHNGIRARAEQGNAWLKMTFTALRRVTIDPWRISAIAAAALVLLHIEHDRTT